MKSYFFFSNKFVSFPALLFRLKTVCFVSKLFINKKILSKYMFKKILNKSLFNPLFRFKSCHLISNPFFLHKERWLLCIYPRSNRKSFSNNQVNRWTVCCPTRNPISSWIVWHELKTSTNKGVLLQAVEVVRRREVSATTTTQWKQLTDWNGKMTWRHVTSSNLPVYFKERNLFKRKRTF